MAAFFSPFSANSYFPALEKVEQDLNITTQQVNLSVTVFMLFQAISPSFWSVLADTHGRRPIYLATLFVYILASIGTALASSYVSLLLFRMLQAFGSSSVIAIGAGTIADIAPPSERGGYLGWYSLGFNIAPLLGPAIGGFLSQYLGWRWIFWTMAIICGIHWLVLGCWLPETLRSLVGNGSGYANPTPMQWWQHQRTHQKSLAGRSLKSWSMKMRHFILLPFQPLLYAKEWDVLALLILYGVQYGACYAMTTSMPYLFSRVYNLSESLIGACYLANGIGCIVGSVFQGKVLNYNYKRLMQSHYTDDNHDFPIEYARLRTLWIHALLFNVLFVVYGWALYAKIHIAIVLSIQFILGFTSQAIFNASQTLLVDMFPDKSASVTATNNMFRCFFGALATVMVLPIIQLVGAGWAFTIISAILLLSRITLVLAMSYGPKWRRQRMTVEAIKV
ncbi:MFS general substrate transporter [Lichtheimia hyalospora FSU 10163]|nr:MFS general substrate transporter [Lichtheimia hyalospora FSU 10163]